MIIDLTKMIINDLYELPIDDEIKIDDKLLKDTDIRDISNVNVQGYIYNNEENYELDVNVSGTMVLGCARTLKDVNYPFNIKINEIILENNDNNLQIIQNRLDIFPIIWQNILADVPLRVLASDATDVPLEGDGWRLITEEDEKEVIDPRLAKLKDFIKE